MPWGMADMDKLTESSLLHVVIAAELKPLRAEFIITGFAISSRAKRR